MVNSHSPTMPSPCADAEVACFSSGDVSVAAETVAALPLLLPQARKKTVVSKKMDAYILFIVFFFAECVGSILDKKSSASFKFNKKVLFMQVVQKDGDKPRLASVILII